MAEEREGGGFFDGYIHELTDQRAVAFETHNQIAVGSARQLGGVRDGGRRCCVCLFPSQGDVTTTCFDR